MDVDPDVRVDTPPSPVFKSNRSGRRLRIPGHYKDFLPSEPTPLAHIPSKTRKPRRTRAPRPIQVPDSIVEEPDEDLNEAPEFFDTEPNEMGLFRRYYTIPTHDPADGISLSNVCDSPTLATTSSTSGSRSTPFSLSSLIGTAQSLAESAFAPFQNITTFRIVNWFYSGSNMKSAAELDHLVHNVLLQDDFDKAHLVDFSAKRELDRLDKYKAEKDKTFPSSGGWKESSVKIHLPAPRVKCAEENAPELEIPGLMHRSLVDVITSTFQDAVPDEFHMTPFEWWWKPSEDEPEQRVHSEIYTSPSMLEEHKAVEAQLKEHPEPGPEYEVVIAAMMLWSDSTHLANFRTAALWPIYTYFGNLSKYVRGKPTAFASHHTAYIPKVSVLDFTCTSDSLNICFQLPNNIQDVYQGVVFYISD
jgi:hypothetical protein